MYMYMYMYMYIQYICTHTANRLFLGSIEAPFESPLETVLCVCAHASSITYQYGHCTNIWATERECASVVLRQKELLKLRERIQERTRTRTRTGTLAIVRRCSRARVHGCSCARVRARSHARGRERKREEGVRERG